RIGEWGFAAIVEVDGHRILFDTGARPNTVLENARELKVDLAGVPEVVLSHNHSDHTGGLLTLRRDVQARDAAALTRVHVGRGLFWSRPTADGAGESNLPLKTRADYAAAGLTFVEHDSAQQILPGVWLSGPAAGRAGSKDGGRRRRRVFLRARPGHRSPRSGALTFTPDLPRGGKCLADQTDVSRKSAPCHGAAPWIPAPCGLMKEGGQS